ncbi:MAG TPA: UDP-N-acetylglucosamine 2-epimerase [Bacteroidia bacterium]|nr:UDP-N-acetylglucosamine 2-epimerase [Bacteroidia bacterium]
MKIGVLTSSRADYGIYLPLLERIKKDGFFAMEIIAFGSHFSTEHGYTFNEIEKDRYQVIHQLKTITQEDTEEGIVKSYGHTILEFAGFWKCNKYDLVFCLGDRYEMSAAVQAGIPFGVKFAHLHGGETTLGAIDNIYRHQITLASGLHFTSTIPNKKKVSLITGSGENVYAVGSLSLNNILKFKAVDKNLFYSSFYIPQGDFALVTFHPETVSVHENKGYIVEMAGALKTISETLNLVITMPNADTLGSSYRDAIYELKRGCPTRIILVENFGKTNYFSAMHYARVLIGNTSSGIIEAASFKKFVVDVGNRQKGRAHSKNVLHANFTKADILEKSYEALRLGEYNGENIYFKKNVTNKILKVLKNIL